MSTNTISESDMAEARPVSTPPFSATEQEAFHTDDRGAVTAIASIIVTIVTAALIGYSVIAYIALSGQ